MGRGTDAGAPSLPGGILGGMLPRVVRWLKSPSLALAAIAFLTAWAGCAAWLPWVSKEGVPAPAWATVVGLDRPFSSAPFLAAAALLFAGTLACTWARTGPVAARWNGSAAGGLLLEAGPDWRDFLRARGFREARGSFFRFRFAVWSGWIMHLGLLALMAGILVQRAFHDGGRFELAEGEMARLDGDGVVFGRDRGLLAREPLPDIEVALDYFDPFEHQRGYAPDRRSRLRIRADGSEAVGATLDRARGVTVARVTIHQAIPTGIAVVLRIGEAGNRVIRLRGDGGTRAAAEVTDRSGGLLRVVVASERPLDDPSGTGRLALWIERGAERALVQPGTDFDFGGVPARVVAFSRWGGFSWSSSPGMPAVIAGFLVLVGGCLLMVFPAAVGEPLPDGSGCRLWSARGSAWLEEEWRTFAAGERKGEE